MSDERGGAGGEVLSLPHITLIAYFFLNERGEEKSKQFSSSILALSFDE